MGIEPKLSENFNKRLFGEIKRNIQLKSIFDITITSFLKAIGSLLEIILQPAKSFDKTETIDNEVKITTKEEK